MARSDNRNARRHAHDFADYAQEFLRRNSAYQRQFARLSGVRKGAGDMAAAVRMAHTWGLEFPC